MKNTVYTPGTGILVLKITTTKEKKIKITFWANFEYMKVKVLFVLSLSYRPTYLAFFRK